MNECPHTPGWKKNKDNKEEQEYEEKEDEEIGEGE